MRHISVPTPFGNVDLVLLYHFVREDDVLTDRANFDGKLTIEGEDWLAEFTLERNEAGGDWALRKHAHLRRPLPWTIDLIPWDDAVIKPNFIGSLDLDQHRAAAESEEWLAEEQLRAVAFQAVYAGMREIMTMPNWKDWVKAYHTMRPDLGPDPASPVSTGYAYGKEEKSRPKSVAPVKPDLRLV